MMLWLLMYQCICFILLTVKEQVPELDISTDQTTCYYIFSPELYGQIVDNNNRTAW